MIYRYPSLASKITGIRKPPNCYFLAEKRVSQATDNHVFNVFSRGKHIVTRMISYSLYGVCNRLAWEGLLVQVTIEHDTQLSYVKPWDDYLDPSTLDRQSNPLLVVLSLSSCCGEIYFMTVR
eukprot:scaffold153432_cov47-Attheya_sp.AAC.2